MLGACSSGGAQRPRRRRQHRRPAVSRRPRHPSSAAPSAAAVACDSFTILNHRTDLDQSGDWKKLYVDPFQAKYPGIKAIKTESITDYHNIVKTRLNTTDYGDVLVIPNGVTASEYPNFFEPLGHGRRPQDQVPVHRGDRQLRRQGLRHRHQRQRQRHPLQQEGLRGGRHHRLAQDARRVHRRPAGDQGQGARASTRCTRTTRTAGRCPSGSRTRRSRSLTRTSRPRWPTTPRRGTPGKGQYIIDKLLYDVVKAGLNEKDPTTTDWEPSKQLVATGKIGAMALGSWAISQMQGVAKTAGADPADIGYMPFPNQVDGKFQSTVGGDLRLAINKNTKCMDAAKAWVSYFIDESGYAANEDGIPTVASRGAAPDWFKAFQDAGVNLFAENPPPAGEEGLRDNIAKEAEIDIWGNVYRQALVDDARGQTDDGMDKIFADLNKKWADGQDRAGRLIQPCAAIRRDRRNPSVNALAGSTSEPPPRLRRRPGERASWLDRAMSLGSWKDARVKDLVVARRHPRRRDRSPWTGVRDAACAPPRRVDDRSTPYLFLLVPARCCWSCSPTSRS